MEGETIEKKVDELISIVESIDSSLDEQLDAVKELLKLKNEKSLDYLRKLSCRETKTVDRHTYGGEPYGWPSLWSYSEIEHNPHAKGNLYSALRTETGYDEWSNTPGAFQTLYHTRYAEAKKVMTNIEKL